MAVEKALYTNGSLPPPVEEGEIIVEVENPDSVTVQTEDMLMEMDFDEQTPTPGHYDNLVDYMDECDLQALGSELVGLFKADHESRGSGRSPMLRVLTY